MASKIHVEICLRLMKEVSYLFLDHLLKMTDREYKIAQRFVSKYHSLLDKSMAQKVLD